MLWTSTIQITEDTPDILPLPAFGEGTEGKQGCWLTFQNPFSTMDQGQVRPTIDGAELRKQDTGSAVGRDRSPHPKSLYLQSLDKCTASFFLSILFQNSWYQGSNVLVLGHMPSIETFVSCLSARRVRGSAILCYHDCCHKISLTCAHSSSSTLVTSFSQVVTPKQPCKSTWPRNTKTWPKTLQGIPALMACDLTHISKRKRGDTAVCWASQPASVCPVFLLNKPLYPHLSALFSSFPSSSLPSQPGDVCCFVHVVSLTLSALLRGT